MSDPTRLRLTHRYQVQYRWTVAPPHPFTNDWQLSWSFYELANAQEAKRDDEADCPYYEYRIVDTQAKEQSA